jgi:catechol 2,3-dioxygenase-like lactoylglutathione lyase family enzyme
MPAAPLARRLGYIVLSTSDLERDVGYYADVIGLSLAHKSAKHAHFVTPVGLAALTLEADGEPGLRALAFQVAPEQDLKTIKNTILQPAGIQADLRTNVTPTVDEILCFVDPDGTRIDLFTSFRFAEPARIQPGIAPLKLGHVARFTTQIDKMIDFYCTVLGFRLSDWREGAAYFLRCNPDHHTVNFFRSDRQFVEHIAFELRDAAEVTRACDVLALHGIRLDWGPSRHFIGHNYACYHYVADRYRIELYAELDQMKDEELGFFEPRPWHQNRPQRPQSWSRDFTKNYWGAY